MDPAPREAFIAGHNIAYTAAYFDQVLFAARLANQTEQSAKDHSAKMIHMLQQVGRNFADRMKHVNLIAQEAALPQRPLPALPPDFYPWANLTHKDFIDLWAINDPAGCLFAIGHAVGEIRNGLIVLNLCLDFEQNLRLDCTKERMNLPKRITASINRWTTADAVLGTTSLNNVPQKYLQPIKGQVQTIIGLIPDQKKGWSLIPVLNQKLLSALAGVEREIILDLPSSTDP